MAEERHFRKLSELSLIDNYLFGLYIQEATEEEIIGLLERMLDIKITGIKIKEKQHSIYNDTDEHGVVLDAYIKDDKGNIYNIEVQAYSMKCLPKRMRFQQSLIDRELMPRGTFDYDRLPKTIIIYVTNFDPFGKGLYRYTFKNTCVEDNSVDFNDETLKVVLNAAGTQNAGVSDELVELLRYFMKSDEETARTCISEYVRNLEKKVKPIKNSKKFGDDFMSYQEAIYNSHKEGKAIGIEIGKIAGFIEASFDFGKSLEETISGIMEKFTLSRKEAEEYVNQYRPKVN